MKMFKKSIVLFVFIFMLVFGTGIASAYQQAPMLDELVNNGELSPVDERLPENPYITEVHERIGDYGGTLTWGATSATDDPKLMALYNNINLVRYAQDLTVKPDLASSYEISDDATTYTFHLRKGVRWSDGELFTADDIMFWYNDILLNEDITPESGAGWIEVQGELPVIEKVDNYTVKIIFPAANPYFLQSLAFPGQKPYAAAHYLKQFHKDYVGPDELAAKVESSQFDSWVGLFEAENSKKFFRNPDLPVIEPWILVTEPPSNRFVYKRNPYFYKVDEEGNQLPYLDKVVLKIVSDKQVLALQTSAGVFDLQMRSLFSSDYTLYKNNAEKGNYIVYLWTRKTAALPTIAFNITYNEDPWLAELIQNAKFRKALSVAINREEINQVIWKGLGVPRQVTVYPQWKGFKEEWANAYAEYDPERANKLLDEAGFTEKNSDGIRLKDSKPINITVYTGDADNTAKIFQMIKDYWKDVGIALNIKVNDKTLLYTRRDANKLPIARIGSGGWSPTLPYNYVPVSSQYSSGNWWAPLYAKWYESGGKQGKEPPAKIKKLMDIYDQIQVTVDQDKRIELWQEIFDTHSENQWMIGCVGLQPSIVVKKHYVHNVPEKALADWSYGAYFGPSEFYQFFIEKSAQ